jgi:branched-chain amino acid transport system permease protein
MRVINFAQGDFVMLGMYLAWYVYALQAVNPIFLALLSFLVLGGVGVALHWLLVKRVTGLGSAAIAGHDAQLI